MRQANKTPRPSGARGAYRNNYLKRHNATHGTGSYVRYEQLKPSSLPAQPTRVSTKLLAAAPPISRGCNVSVKILSKVWDGYPGDSSPELLALLALADWSDDEGRSFPSIAALGKKCRIGRSQTQRIVHRLIGTGLVSVTDNASGGAPGSSRRYRINLDLLTGRENATRSENATGRGNATEGPRKCADRGRENATLYVIDPSLTVNKGDCPPSADGKAADCPHQEIINLYHDILPMGRQVKVWNETRKAKLRARWREASERQSLDWWGRLFFYIAKSEFLTGKASTKDRAPFEIDLEWIVTPSNFIKIVEGKYHREAV